MKSATVRRVARCAAALVAGATVVAYAAGGAMSPGALLAQVQKNYDPSRAIAADYTLVIYWSVREKEEKRQGSLSLDSGDRFHIAAGVERFVSNGATYWHHHAGSRQVTVRRLADVDLSMLPSQLFSRFIVSCPFVYRRSDKGLAEFAWTGDSAGVPYRSIRVWVRENTGIIERCLMTDRNQNTFTYTFTATTTGTTIPGRVFEFTIPKNATVVDLRD